jgi:hypothetical protein
MAKTKKIHINQHNIRTNRQLGTNLPVITCKTYNSNDYYHRLSIDCDPPVDIIYSPDNPLSCGAHVWIETKAEVTGELQ